MPLPEFGGMLDIKRAAHLLRRATFGASISQIKALSTMTPAAAVAQLFGPGLPDPVLPIDPESGTTWIAPGQVDTDRDGELQDFYKAWFIGQMMAAGVSDTQALAYSAREKIVLFLHSHFTCIQSKVNDSRAMYYQNELFRQFALDRTADPEVNFKTLTVKVSVDNAMLRLLDGELNVRGSVNENYARELHELYSIGRGLEGTVPTTTEDGDYYFFTEKDVQEAAKVLSGWSFDDSFQNTDIDTGLPRGKVKGSPTNASAHDNSVKVFSARFGNATITPNPLLMNGGNPTEESAIDEIVQLVDQIYLNTETAKHICWKIYRFFVYAPHTTADSVMIDNPIITEMANTFAANGYKIQPVIENLLRSVHFYDAAGGVNDDNFGGIIKSPLDLTLGTLRLFNIPVPSMTTDMAGFYAATGQILSTMSDLGMNFYEPFDVSGYDAYHQWPIYHRAWITPNYLSRRYRFIGKIVNETEDYLFKVNVYDFVKTSGILNPVAGDARELIKTLALYLLPLQDTLTYDEALDDNSGLTAMRMKYFLQRFVQDLTADPEAYWTSRWNAGTGIADLRAQLEFLFNAMMQSPEYQLA